ncbi:MAG: hypothetical protein NVS1B1_12650 [Candidatus Limnocylindrales bacterium]
MPQPLAVTRAQGGLILRERRAGGARTFLIAWAPFVLCAFSPAALTVMVALAPDPASYRELFLRLGLSVLAYPAVGALLASRQPRHAVAWTLMAIGLCFELAGFGAAYAEFARLPAYRALPDPGLVTVLTSNFGLAGAGSMLLLILIFPDGRYLSPRWRWVGVLVIAYSVVLALFGWIQPGPIPLAPSLNNPLGVPALRPLVPLLARAGMLLVPFGLLATISAVLRFRRSSGVVRQQLKWVAAAVVVFAVIVFPLRIIATTPLGASIPTAGGSPIPGAFGGIPFAIGYATVAIAIGVSIFRYRLYDIDLLIRRTLVYGAVSMALLAAYVGGVALFQFVLTPFTSGSPVAVAVSTLVVVALFQPLRTRIGSAVDRRFYRAKYDAERTLDAFAARLRDEVDLEAVRADLLEAVSETMRPAHASFWLRSRPS